MPNEQKPQNPAVTSNGINLTARHNARHYAMQAIYQWQLADASMQEIETEFLLYQVDREIELDYFKELIHGVPALQAEIDKELRYAIDRPFQEIDAIELAVLRLAIYELLKRPDIPFPVIINEALKLTKKFGSIEGYKFVNGVLDKIAKKIRAVERKMREE